VSETPVVLPKWGLTMLDATLVEWLKQEGERVEARGMPDEVRAEREHDRERAQVERDFRVGRPRSDLLTTIRED